MPVAVQQVTEILDDERLVVDDRMRPFAAVGTEGGAGGASAGIPPAGSRSVKTLPRPSSLPTVTSPPCRLTIP